MCLSQGKRFSGRSCTCTDFYYPSLRGKLDSTQKQCRRVCCCRLRPDWANVCFFSGTLRTKRKITAMSTCHTFQRRIPPLASSFIPNRQTLTATMILWRHSWLKWRQDPACEMFVKFCGSAPLLSGAANAPRGFGSHIRNVP